MSLTRFLDNTESRSRFKAAFKKPRLDLSAFKLVAPPQTTNYGLVGCAFDYLFRFNIQHRNPKAIAHPWFVETKLGLGGKKADNTIKEAKKHVAKYLQSGLVTDELLACCLKLSVLESFYRSGISDAFENFKVNKNDVKDLKAICDNLDFNSFKEKHYIELNPSFGRASKAIRGADADLILDNTIVDIKCTKNLEIDRDDYNQILGYYALNTIEKNTKSKRPEINSVAIYFARYKAFVSFDLEDVIIKDEINDFFKWFKKAIKL
jgi:hypothetical protein